MGISEFEGVDAVGREALRKISWRLLPLIGLGYAIAYMDRVNISFASLQMNIDLHFSATVYGFGAGLFFLSYALLEVPSNLLLVRFGARRWLFRIMLTWGVVAIGMMFVRTPTQFYDMRLLLGAAEAGFFPGVIYYLTQWYPSAHRGRAISRFYVAWPLSTVIMGVVAGALLGLRGTLGLAGWQWLFLVEGLPAIVISVFFLKFLPDKPAAAKWLSAEERGWIARRLAADAAELDAQASHNFLGILGNPLVLQLAVVNFVVLGTFYAFNLSAPAILVQATHLSITAVGYLTAGAGLFAAVAMLFNGWHSDHRRERFVHLMAPLALMAIAFAAMAMSSSGLVVAAAYVLAFSGNMAVAAVFWLIPGDLLHPRIGAVSVAAINAVGQFGSFLSPFAWGLAKDRTGSFTLGLAVLPLLYLFSIAIVASMQRKARRG